MSRAVRAIWDGTYGLLVDDGSLALGALGAVAVTWLFGSVAHEIAAQLGGALLLVLVSALVLANLYLAGRRIQRTP